MVKGIFRILLVVPIFLSGVASAQEGTKTQLSINGKIVSLALAANEVSELKYWAEVDALE